jgi:hypothetical protein
VVSEGADVRFRYLKARMLLAVSEGTDARFSCRKQVPTYLAVSEGKDAPLRYLKARVLGSDTARESRLPCNI